MLGYLSPGVRSLHDLLVAFRRAVGWVPGPYSAWERKVRRPVPARASEVRLFLDRPIAFDPGTGIATLAGLNKTEAEQVLDWLEATGNQQRQLCLDRETFTVRWKR